MSPMSMPGHQEPEVDDTIGRTPIAIEWARGRSMARTRIGHWTIKDRSGRTGNESRARR
ncbi:hypothetical protein KZ829_13340 [Actinoplanes hulinensis]|uniref:Uncharacterized protein n=1 Tax=Actinoplanes hulinensis TaxID=1144547 RepID=A0ABS7B232_9ACTN|nr:hypothetical protein [Actinoplanes hulinensis]MBW6434721.1 hypothetical protein [Actinoplanes hulinensis]